MLEWNVPPPPHPTQKKCEWMTVKYRLRSLRLGEQLVGHTIIKIYSLGRYALISANDYALPYYARIFSGIIDL